MAMDASGKDVIIVETVGVGQDEVDIMRIADTICLVLAPGLGDIIQSMKAGLMEIADVYVVNKSDYSAADKLFSEVNNRMLQDAKIKDVHWTLLVVKTIATEQWGIDSLVDAILSHQDQLRDSGRLLEKRRQRIRQQTLQMIHQALFQLLKDRLIQNGRMEALVDAILDKKENRYQAIRKIIAEFICIPS